MLWWTLRAFDRSPLITGTVLVVGADHRPLAEQMLADHPLDRRPVICIGGKERADSVVAGIAALPDEVDLVAVHDGARPLLTDALIDRVVDRAAQSGAAIAALPAHDTIKQGKTQITQTLDRSEVWHAQTPQVFAAQLLRRAYERWSQAGRAPVTDDAEIVERSGHRVDLVVGERNNIKITLKEELPLAEALLGNPEGASMTHGAAGQYPRTGFGFDVHALVANRALVLGGVTIAHPLGLDGHSDADVVCHAIADALLGAAALGDIGVHFPPSDPAFKDANSLDLLRQVGKKVQQAGYQLGNLDTVIACQRPKLAPHLPQMAANIAEALGAPVQDISLKATTTERLGFVGREQGISAYATVLLIPRAGAGVSIG